MCPVSPKPLPSARSVLTVLRGGTCEITRGMISWLEKDTQQISKNIVTNAVVTAISQDNTAAPNDRMRVDYGDGIVAKYAHVITTTALPCLKAVDLSNAMLTFPQKTALRALTYGAATKVGVKFRTAWWTDAAVMQHYGGVAAIDAGQSITDYMSRVIVYPHYGLSIL